MMLGIGGLGIGDWVLGTGGLNLETQRQNRENILDKLIKSRIPMAKKKVPNSRRANPE